MACATDSHDLKVSPKTPSRAMQQQASLFLVYGMWIMNTTRTKMITTDEGMGEAMRAGMRLVADIIISSP